MVTVGIRELKNRLSKYLRMVRAGELVQVTDRGTVVAEIRAPGAPRGAEQLPQGLLELARRDQLTLGLPNDRDLYPIAERPLLRGASAADLLDAERGER